MGLSRFPKDFKIVHCTVLQLNRIYNVIPNCVNAITVKTVTKHINLALREKSTKVKLLLHVGIAKQSD